jgi:uncharacterized coiled-coil DUF342 family protein
MSRPVPTFILLLLLASLCGLCAWQWQREEQLRDLTRRQQAQTLSLQKELDELNARAKAADAEILRLTAALSELRTASIAKSQYDEALEAARKMREGIQKQNAALKEQQDALTKANTAIATANEQLRKLANERDTVVQKLNALTQQYNKLSTQLQSGSNEKSTPPDSPDKKAP